MRALRVLDVKTFMAQLFLGEGFDFFLLHELEIETANQFRINGRLNRSWYDSDELEHIGDREYILWKEVRSLAFQVIKGSKSPQLMKLVFSLPKEKTKRVLEKSGAGFLPEQVMGVFLNVKYENGELLLITGTSVSVFSMDKALEQEWDNEIAVFLKKCGIACEER